MQHSPIAHRFFSGYGVRLQNIDSVIAEHVINKMTEQEIPVLCVHDSFIVASHESENLDRLMQEAFGKVIDTFSERDKPAVAKVKLSNSHSSPKGLLQVTQSTLNKDRPQQTIVPYHRHFSAIVPWIILPQVLISDS